MINQWIRVSDDTARCLVHRDGKSFMLWAANHYHQIDLFFGWEHLQETMNVNISSPIIAHVRAKEGNKELVLKLLDQLYPPHQKPLVS